MFHPVQQSQQHYPVNNKRQINSRRSEFQSSFTSPSKNYIWTKLQVPVKNSVKIQYQSGNDNQNPQHFQRQLPAISKKIPIRSDFNPFYLQVHNKRRKMDQLRRQLHQQISREQLQYLTKLKMQDEMDRKKQGPLMRSNRQNNSRSVELPIISSRGSKQKQEIQQRKQALARAAENDNQLKKHLFGIQYMGRRKDIGAVYQKTDKKQEQEKEQQRKMAWINFVIKKKREDQRASKNKAGQFRKPIRQNSQQSQQTIN